MTAAGKVIAIVAALLGAAGAAQGQPSKSALDGFTPPSMAPGSPAGSFALSGFDTINPGNRRLSFSLPLHVVRGRGEVEIPIELPMGVDWTARSYPSCLETQAGAGCIRWRMNYTMTPNWWNEGSPLAVRYLPALVKYRQPQDLVYTPTALGGYQLATRAGLTNTTLTATLGDRTEMELRDAQTGGKEDWTDDNQMENGLPLGFNRGKLFTSVDGSAASFLSDTEIRDVTNGGSGGGPLNANGWLLLKNGTRMHIVEGVPVEIIDRNGNKADLAYTGTLLSSITDPNGHAVSISYVPATDPEEGCTGKKDQITYYGRNGTQHAIVVNFKLLGNVLRNGFALQTYSQLFPNPVSVGGNDVWGLSTTTTFNPCLVSDVVLPNQQKYVFQYNSHGLLGRVELPTGGAYEYDYSIEMSLAGVSPPYSVLLKQLVSAKRTYRNATDPTEESVIEFSSPTYDTRVVKHSGGGQILSWQRISLLAGETSGSMGSMLPSWRSLREWKTEELEAEDAVVRRTEKTWEQRPVDASFNAETFAGDDPQSDGARLHDPRVTEEKTIWQATTETARRTIAYDRYNNPTQVKEYDYGAATPLRRVETRYVTGEYDGVGTTAAVTAHLRALPSSEEVYATESGGTALARTEYYYDGVTESSSTRVAPTANGDAVQRAAAFGGSWSLRGNLTRMRRLKDSGGSVYTVTSGTYDLNGNLLSRVDARGYTTAYGYADNEIANCGAGGSLRYAHPTKVTLPPADGGVMEEKYCWDTYIDGLLQRKDANAQLTSYEYETTAEKLDRLALVTQADGATTEYGYCDTPGLACGWPVFGSLPGNSVGTMRSYLSAPLKSLTQYDGLGRVTETRQKGTRDVVAERSYDGMGRVVRSSAARYFDEVAVWTASSWDALGRLKKRRNEGDSSEQRWTPATVETAYVDEARAASLTSGESRLERRDALGRLVAVREDNGGANTMTYYRYL